MHITTQMLKFSHRQSRRGFYRDDYVILSVRSGERNRAAASANRINSHGVRVLGMSSAKMTVAQSGACTVASTVHRFPRLQSIILETVKTSPFVTVNLMKGNLRTEILTTITSTAQCAWMLTHRSPPGPSWIVLAV